MNFGENIYRLRTERNMSQGNLADALDVSRQSVSKWENNSAVPELEKLIRMAQLFGVTLDELVSGPGTQAPSAPPPEPEPVPEKTNDSGDLISTVLLVFSMVVPRVLIATKGIHLSRFLLFCAMFLITPLSTLGAAFCSRNNKFLFRAFLIYDISFCIGLMFLFGIPAGLLPGCINSIVLLFWACEPEK